jgi:hypothetical protein
MAVNLILVLSAVLGCSANPDRARNSSEKNGSHRDRSNSTISPELFRELRHRSPPLVDLHSIPSGNCLFGGECTYPTPDVNDIPSCPLYPISCPADSTKTDCYSYALDCFCTAPRPLWCAWGCGWLDWYGVEDWFTKTCPDTSPVDFSTLPACAASCISDGSFNYGCITQTESCFCLHEDLFDCPAHCQNPTDVQHITNWYAQTCGYSQQEAAGIVNAGQSTATSSGGKTGAVIQPSKSEKLHWYEILVIATASLTVITAAVCTVLICIWNKSPKYQRQKWLDVTSKKLTSDVGGVQGVSDAYMWRQQSRA